MSSAPVHTAEPQVRHWRGTVRGAIALAVLAACTFAVLAATDHGSAPVPGTAQAQEVSKVLALSETVAAVPVDLVESLQIAGEVKALRHVSLSAQVAGIAGDVTHLPGETVLQSDLMLSIAADNYRLALAGAEAERNSLLAQLEVARSALARAAQLAASGTMTGASLEQAQSAVAVLEAGLAAADIRVRQADLDLQRAQIHAPISGSLASRSVEPGQLVQAGDALFEIVDLSAVTVEALVPLGLAAQLRAGQAAVLWAPGAPATRIAARVGRIAPQAVSGTRSVSVWLEVDNTQAGLRIGSFLKGEITLQTAPGRLALPPAAIRADGTVLVIRKGIAIAVPVRRGAVWNNGALIEVSGDLMPGDRVVALPLQGLAPGDSVQVSGE